MQDDERARIAVNRHAERLRHAYAHLRGATS
jgi:hypothetical protein